MERERKTRREGECETDKEKRRGEVWKRWKGKVEERLEIKIKENEKNREYKRGLEGKGRKRRRDRETEREARSEIIWT